MSDHFKEKHSGTPMPEALAADVALRYHEEEGTRQLLKGNPKNVKVAWAVPSAHVRRARLCFRAWDDRCMALSEEWIFG